MVVRTRSAGAFTMPWMKRIAAALAILLAVSCATTRTHTDASVRETLAGFMNVLNGLDLEGIASYFADDVRAFVPLRQAERVDGKPAVVEIFRRYVDVTKKTTSRTDIVPEDVVVDMSGDLAVVSFNVKRPDEVARRTLVMRWNGSRWLITHMHASQMQRANVVK